MKVLCSFGRYKHELCLVVVKIYKQFKTYSHFDCAIKVYTQANFFIKSITLKHSSSAAF